MGIFFFMTLSCGAIYKTENIEIDVRMRNVSIEWEKINLKETEGVAVVRKKEACPENFYDGELLYRGNGNNFIDNDLSGSDFYCYEVFLHDSLGAIISLGESGLIKTKTLSEFVGVFFEDNIFIGSGIILIFILVLLNIKKRFSIRKY